jgi:hypothetical protein
MEAGKALAMARLRGAELGEMALELVEDAAGRFLQANLTADEDRKKGKEESEPIIDSTQIFGIKFNTIIQVGLLGAIAFFGYRFYKKQQGGR